MNCPKCSGPMWDNRADKRNPKSPDFKCKNRSCGEAVWEKRDSSPASNGNGTVHVPPPSSQRALGPLYAECLEFAQKACAHYFKDEATSADVIAATATLFIQAVRDGAPIRAPKPAPPPPPPVRTPDAYDDDRSLPF